MDKVMLVFLILAVVGITGLWIISGHVSSVEFKIGDITADNAGTFARVSGSIQRLSESEDGYFLTMSDSTDSIKAVIWKRSFPHLNLTENQNVEIIGTISLYRGEIEIIADRVEIVG